MGTLTAKELSQYPLPLNTSPSGPFACGFTASKVAAEELTCTNRIPDSDFT